ncbi:PREDICTED: histone-lysine N-methyltransferase SETMAR-like [Atta cephalotes]|uniref:Mos1 transposase HTH domain-containing protein n=1 Tax=Atta cephalotes TaxID=12957 RepID=A0A158NIU5_ATTCE|nr:PREDICTED: histone-lysine N-methyltransferase SETMAR-like [Atta cephalotes]
MRKHNDMLSASIRAVVCGLSKLRQDERVDKPIGKHLMLFFYRKGKNATQAANKICAIYGEGAEKTVRKWFARFKADDFNLEDQECPGKPSITDEDQIKILIENNPRYMTRKLAEMLNTSKSIIHEHFVKLSYINRFDIWVPHDLTEKNLMDRISICDSLYKRNEETPFLKQVVTGGEVLFPIIIDELKSAIEQKHPEIANRKGVVFHQDNARPHVFDNSTKVVGARLGCSIPSTIFTRSRAF